MIDCSGEYWHGDEADDINDYLKAYSGADEIDVKPVYCHLCGGFSFLHRIDSEECIQVEQTAGTVLWLLSPGTIFKYRCAPEADFILKF